MREAINPATGRPYSNYEIADQLGVDEASVRRGLRRAGYKPYLVPASAISLLDTVLEDPIRIDSRKLGPGAVTADWHHPLTNYDLVNTFLDHARDIGATNWLLVAGDWFHVDWLSRFDFKQETAGAKKEIMASTITLEKVLETFDRVILSWGNHDARLHKTLGYKVPFSTAMRWLFEPVADELMARVELSNLDHVIVDTAQGPYFVAHPKAYSSVPLTNARRLASKKLMHVVTGHSHHTAVGHDVSGKFVSAEIGGFFAADKTEYLQRSTTFPEWQNGYGFIDSDGYLIIEGQGWSSRMGRRA
jgi:hypothetical protein